MDKQQFCDLIRANEKCIYSVAYNILKSNNDIADIIQESILKAYENLEELKDPEKFKPWIMKIVHNTAIDYIRKRHDEIDIDTQSEILIDENQGIDRETVITVYDAVMKLKQPFRSVITLFYYGDFSVRQISAITSTSESTIKVQLMRGRKMLAKLLKREDFLR